MIKAGRQFVADMANAAEEDALTAWNATMGGRSNEEIDEVLGRDPERS